jgi:hypothetical protein
MYMFSSPITGGLKMNIKFYQTKAQLVGLRWIQGMIALPVGSSRNFLREDSGVVNGEC